MEHRQSWDDYGYCACGAQAVYWEDPDHDGYVGDGCAEAGVWPRVRALIECAECGDPIIDAPSARMADPHFWDERPYACRPDFLVHIECGTAAGLERVK